MKRLIAASAAVLLSAFPLISQTVSETTEATEEEETGLTLSLIPRLDGSILNYNQPEGNITSWTLGNSILYSILDGNITDNLSVYACFHLLAPDPSWLYTNTFHSDECSWLDMLSLTYSLGNFDISLGKENLAFGGFEQDADICDPYLDLSTNSWHSIQSFLWGGRLAYNFGEEQNIFFQGLASPFSVYPFQDKLFCATVGWNGCIGNYETMWSFGNMKTGDENPDYENLKLLSLGNRLTLGNVVTTLDVNFRAFSLNSLFSEEMSSLLDVRYCFPKVEIFAKGGWEYCHKEHFNYFAYDEEDATWNIDGTIVPNYIYDYKDYLFAGLGVEYYPLADRSLKLHLVGAANNYNNAKSITAGITYYFDINLK